MKTHINPVDGIESNPNLVKDQNTDNDAWQSILEAIRPVTLKKVVFFVIGAVLLTAFLWFSFILGLA